MMMNVFIVIFLLLIINILVWFGGDKTLRKPDLDFCHSHPAVAYSKDYLKSRAATRLTTRLRQGKQKDDD